MHEYVAGVPNCLCEDAADHAPCMECGSAKGAYDHVSDVPVSETVESSDSLDSAENL